MNTSIPSEKIERKISIVWTGIEREGYVTIVFPVQLSQSRWGCRWSVSYIHDREAWIYGRDPLEAIAHCLAFLKELITGSEQDGIVLWWKERGDHAGF